jgi:hypothetical protein
MEALRQLLRSTSNTLGQAKALVGAPATHVGGRVRLVAIPIARVRDLPSVEAIVRGPGRSGR